jgi:hypothetical protein
MLEVFQTGDYVAIHENPVWRDQADSILRIHLEKVDEQNHWEQLWAKKISDNLFSVCCIPFFAYHLALGDEVETDTHYTVTRIASISGHVTFRVWFADSLNTSIKDQVINQAEKIGCLFEWSSANLLALSAQNTHQSQAIIDYLESHQNNEDLQYEVAGTLDHNDE